jgi:circadian clock protein KaiC
MNDIQSPTDQRVSTGIAGFDEILEGGLIANRTYLLSGAPGTGKTTLGWHFLTAGAKLEEEALYVTFAEPARELIKNAERSGFDVSKIHIVDLSPPPDLFAQSQTYDLFTASDVEREPTTAKIVDAIEKLRPTRVFVDSMTSLRFLTTDTFQFRRQALSFLRYLASRDATVLVTSESTLETPDDDLRYIVDGVVEVERQARTWTIAVTKFRGSGSRSGQHGMMLTQSGAIVYPRLLPERYSAPPHTEQYLPSGLPLLDTMLGGGLDLGSITLVSGPTGVGKTTLTMTFLEASARLGRRSVLYTFDEGEHTLLYRSRKLGAKPDDLIASGHLLIKSIEALRYGADEFAQLVRTDIENFGTQVVVIDSLSGYRMTIEAQDLTERIHALVRYLQNVGVTVLLIDELRDLTHFQISNAGISYLADNVIFLRYFERQVKGKLELQKGIGVLKKRMSDFEKHVREYTIVPGGIRIGDPLSLTAIFGSMPAEQAHSDD